MKDRLKVFVQKYTKQLLAFSIFFVAILITFLGYSFAALTPVESIIITSENSSYVSKEEGSWQVEKSGKWINKGKARITLDVDTSLMTNNNGLDVIFVLDTSNSMGGNKLDRVKQDTIELLDILLSNSKNQAALITFNSSSTILTPLTGDKELLVNEVNNLVTTGETNYYQALVNVDNILKDYQEESNREVIVLFLTDGYPTEGSPNQVTQYQYLKSEYPYITVNAVQYDMGDYVLKPIKEISDNQFLADMDTLYDALFDATVLPIPYEKFEIVDYIDNRYFRLDSKENITVSDGEVTLEEENGKQKITWTIDDFKSGQDAKLTMDIYLKDAYLDDDGIYTTNEKEQIITKIKNEEENVTSTETPVLSHNYTVTYEANAPSGTTVNNLPKEASYFVFDTIPISTQEPTCVGYEFNGWEIVTEGVTHVGEDYFIMPGEDVIIRAKWSKVGLLKSMNGVVSEQGDPIIKKYLPGSNEDFHNSKYQSKITSIVTKDNLEIPAVAIEHWDVSAARDGSVIAYIEDDGRGNGTYKVTIGGQGGVIANSDSSYLFAGIAGKTFTSLETIDLTYFDTSRTVNMRSMFSYGYYDINKDNGCKLKSIIFGEHWDTSNVTNMSFMFMAQTKLVNLDLSFFDTSKVTDMSGMFSGCLNLTSLDFCNADFSSVTSYDSMFSSANASLRVTVKNSTASSWIRSRLDEGKLYGATVVIA